MENARDEQKAHFYSFQYKFRAIRRFAYTIEAAFLCVRSVCFFFWLRPFIASDMLPL